MEGKGPARDSGPNARPHGWEELALPYATRSKLEIVRSKSSGFLLDGGLRRAGFFTIVQGTLLGTKSKNGWIDEKKY